MVTVIAVPLTRISIGSSTASVSGLATAPSAVRWLARRRAVTLPIELPRCARPPDRVQPISTALDTGVFDLAAT